MPSENEINLNIRNNFSAESRVDVNGRHENNLKL